MKKKMQREVIFRETRLRKKTRREGYLPMKPRVTQGTSERHRPSLLTPE
jgi:hypothetical protein